MRCDRFVFLLRFSSFNRLVVHTLPELISSIICFSWSGKICRVSARYMWTLLGICFSSTYGLTAILLIFLLTLSECNPLFWWLNLSGTSMSIITFLTSFIAVKCLLASFERKFLPTSDRTIKVYWAFSIDPATVWYLYLQRHLLCFLVRISSLWV